MKPYDLAKVVDDVSRATSKATARTLAFIVPGRPITWKRPKGHGGGYTNDPAANRQLRNLKTYFIAEAANASIRFRPDEPVSARLHFHFNGRAGGFTGIEIFPYCPPWAEPRSRLYQAPNEGSDALRELIPNIERIDVDNLTKLVLEAASGSGVVPDDRQFVRIGIWKTGSTKKAPTLPGERRRK